MTNEIFRFSVLRPFQKRDPKNIRNKVIVSYSPQHHSHFYQDLKDAKDNNDRAETIKKAQEYRTGDVKFVKNLIDLKMPLDELDKWIFGKERQVTFHTLTSKVDEIFKDAGIQDWKAWIKGAEYKTDLGRLSDSLLACSVGVENDKLSQALRPKLVRGLRLSQLLKQLANDDNELKAKDGIGAVLRALVLLPKEVFPIPPRDIQKEREKILESYEKEKKRTEEQRENVFKLIKKLEKLHTAKTEINDVNRKISRPDREKEKQKRYEELEEELKTTKRKSGGLFGSKSNGLHEFEAKQFIEKDTSWILTDNAKSKISDDTMTILNEIGVDTDSIHVRDVTTEIEDQIYELSKRLHSATPKAKTVKIGNNFLSMGLIAPLVPQGITLIQPAPGTIDVQVPVAPESPVTEAISVPTGKGNVQPIGYSELFVVREEIQKYEPGEVAHIENILEGENKERQHKRTREVEEVFVTEKEEIEETERDLQTSDRFELQTNSERAMQETLQAEAGIEATFNGIGYEVKANAGIEYERATQESCSKATNISHEVINKTLSHIRERKREERVKKTREIIEETNLHVIKNDENPQGNITGIYRWVDKIHKAEVINYGRRLMFEFMIPEPAAFFKYAETLTPIEGTTMEKPEPPVYGVTTLNTLFPSAFNLDFTNTEVRPLHPEDLNEGNYLNWVQKYNVQDVEPFPPLYKIEAIAINEKPTNEQNNDVSKKVTNLNAPDGYVAISAYVGGSFIRHPNGYMRVGVGKDYIVLVGQSEPREIKMSCETETIPIIIVFYRMAAIGMTIEVTCIRTDTKLKEWQRKTFNSIMNAYNNLKSRYDEQLAAAQIQSGIAIQGRNPLKNREIEQTELKKAAISMITGQHFDLFNAMRYNVSPHDYPQMDIEESSAEGKYIQFFEQAFEWHNMSYIFYPYFWGRKENWTDNLHLGDTDPKFEKFLQSGAARVLVPVRQKYETVVLHYLETETGEIWEGGDPPHVEDDLYVSIVDAIKEDHGHSTVEGKGELSVKKDEKLVTGIVTEFTEEDDENREIVIRGKKYRIARVEGLDRIYLKEKYEDDDEDHVPYELGLKFIGEPWEVKIPTSLVWLQPDSELPDFTK